MLYAIRKRRGQWTVCSDENVVLQFETYDEAVATARSAAAVLSQRTGLHRALRYSRDEQNSGSGQGKRQDAATLLLVPCGDGALDDAAGQRS